MSGRALPPARLLAVVAPVSLVGVAAYRRGDVHVLPRPRVVRTTLAGVAAFLVASTLAERFPVPVEGADANGVSLGFVFAVAALVLFGWAPATFIYVTAPTLVALMRGNPAIRTIFNAGVFGIVGTSPGSSLSQMNGTDAGGDPRAGDRDRGDPLRRQPAARDRCDLGVGLRARATCSSCASNVRWTALPFTLMASTALMLVVLWQRTPFLFAALAGPLVAISLYQRSTHRALSAMRLALTDPLTGLGNHRHFHERLQRELALADEADTLVSLCFLDVDDFKRINDRFGHPGRRPRPLARLGAAAPGRRGVPARRRRVRGAAARSRRAGRARDRGVDHRPHRREPTSARRRDHRQRRRRHLSAARSRARLADPPRRRRALLGEGARQEPGAACPLRCRGTI